MQDFQWLNLVSNIALSIVGLVGFALWSAREHLHDFNWSRFWNENKVFWFWAFLCQVLYSSVMAFYPILEQTVAERLIDVINAAMAVNWGIDKTLTVTVVYLSGTWQLSRFAKRASKKKNSNGN